MNTYNDTKHKSIDSYVNKGTLIVNTILLLCHVFFSILFKMNNAPILVAFNAFSIFVYLLLYMALINPKPNLYISVVYVEIYVFMVINVLCLGWDYGFQLYCISFVVTAFYADFYVNLKHRVNKITIVFIAVDILTFLFLRIWTYRRLPIYIIDNVLMIHTFFIVNSLIVFTFIIMYSFIYSGTVFRLETALIDVANSDSLTKLNNRRKMQEIIYSVSEAELVNEQPICVAMFDIDDFKQINDLYGHDYGDEVLKSFGNILSDKHTLQEDFIVCRWGGEEFLVFYKYHSKNENEVLKEFDEVRQIVENKKVTLNGITVNYTVTIGLAFHKPGMSMDELIKQADEQLYNGKRCGKNRVII